MEDGNLVIRKDVNDLIEHNGYPSCCECGAEFTEVEDIEALEYSRTTASADHYYCPTCKKEGIFISSDETLL